MFKGTNQIGTVNYAEEKVYLDSIEQLYDQLGESSDDMKRAAIQKEINRISLKAAEFAVPNEFNKILDEMGGTGTNASTSMEFINYYNSFPSNQIEKWLEVYSHRFIDPVFRLFQSELETVYEEKNMSMDDPIQRMLEKYMADFYRNSPYGQQTILGSVEHLKNPSLSKMTDYFNTYYVANNMALVLSGDFDSESIKPIIQEKFGRWRSGTVPEDLKLEEQAFRGRELTTVRMTPIKLGLLGYRTIPKNHEDELKVEVISNLLSNYASTGLLDELVNDNKILMAMPMHDQYTELGGYYIIYVPKIIGQSLSAAEELIMEQMNKLNAGDFSDELLEGVKTELRIDYEMNLEDMRWRTYAIMDAFLYGIPWEKYLAAPDEIDQITKEDIVAVAGRYLGNNRLVFHSKMGFPKKPKLEKPPYGAVESSNSENRSAYADRIEQMPVIEMDPKFIDFDEDVKISTLQKGVSSFVSKNPINSVFTLSLKYGKGSKNDPMVDQASSIVSYASPSDMDYLEFKQQLQLLGGDLYAYNDLSYTTLEITGLEENLREILHLTNELITKYFIEEKQLEKLVQEIKFEKKYEKKDLRTKSNALGQFALYGNQSDFLSRLDEDAIKALTTNDLVDKFNEISGHEYEVHYCGQLKPAEFNRIYLEEMTIPENLTPSKGKLEKNRSIYGENTILVLNDKKAIQSHINIYVEGGVNDRKSRIRMQGFNNYIDGSMSSILFQEIREFRSLAYGVSGNYRASFHFSEPGYFRGWLSTQSDKTLDAIQVFQSILSDLPSKPERMESIRKTLTLSINASQPTFRQKSNVVSSYLEQGYKEDPRKAGYESYKTMEFSEIESFYEQNLEGKPWLVTIVGDVKRIDMDELARYGKVNVVKVNQLFN
jgi:predicted Zn-dependent peptidase